MTGAHVEYVGFRANESTREYTLRVKQAAGGIDDFTLSIANEAFISRRVRYQDGPDICFLKLQNELAALGGGLPAARLSVSDAELEEYRAAHAPKPPQRRPRPPIAVD
jgi:hypothetical protein